MMLLHGARFYRNGEEVEYTGQTQQRHGATLYEVVVVADSYRIGAALWTYKAPGVREG